MSIGDPGGEDPEGTESGETPRHHRTHMAALGAPGGSGFVGVTGSGEIKGYGPFVCSNRGGFRKMYHLGWNSWEETYAARGLSRIFAEIIYNT